MEYCSVKRNNSDNVKESPKNGILMLAVKGRVDSSNAAEVKKDIQDMISDQTITSLTIDAEDLEYISSAGLRVVLQLKKIIKNLQIINTSPEVYNILEMTGFTEMLQVQKAYRRISIEGAEVIGEGANGKLYRVGQDNVVKVYKNADALERIHRERENARIALVLGIPTAISYDVVKVGDKYGSMFELLNARSFSKILDEEPERFSWCVQQFADMMKLIHETEVPPGKLPRVKHKVISWVHLLEHYLDQKYYDKLTALVEEVPDINHMIHGDYHIKNLELQDNEVLLIDMDTLATGYPVFELGFSYNSFIGYGERDPVGISGFLDIPYETSVRFFYAVLSRYLDTDNPLYIQEVLDKARVIGYVRMIRRALEKGYPDQEDKKPVLQLWTEHLMELLKKVDTLMF